MTGKRKFGFNLTPLKIPSNAENDALRRALDGDFSPISSPGSPQIDRQYISRSTEQELKAACRLLVEKTGNAHQNSKEDALINFSTLQRAAKHKPSTGKLNDGKKPVAKSETSPEASHEPEKAKPAKSALSELATAGESRKNEHKEKQSSELAVTEQKPENKQPQFPLRRDSLSSKKHAQVKKNPKSEAVLPLPAIADRARTAPPISDDESCQNSPHSASTDFQPQSASTALTSIPPTPLSKSSFKISQPAHPIPKTPEASNLRITANAGETQVQPGVTEHIREDQARAPANDKRFISGFKDFVRNRSRSRSRSRELSTLKRTTSTLQNWRSGWSLRRKQSQGDLCDMSASVGSASVHQRHASRPDVDLNRALPPLPSLNTYQEESKQKIAENSEPEPKGADIKLDNKARPKTRAATISATPQMKSDTQFSDQADRERSSSLTVAGSQSVTISTAAQKSSRKISVAESRVSSQDSCFSPSGTDQDAETPKRSMDVMKAAAIARTHAADISGQANQQLQVQTRIESSGAPKSSATSRQTSRPTSRGTSKAPTPARYTIIPHQRAPSQPVLSTRSSAPNIHLPPRPATRDASSVPSRSRLPSFGGHSQASSHPPLPVNFSRKIEDATSRPTTSGGLLKTDTSALQPTGVNEITALPLYPTKKQPGLRRMFSSISLRKPKTHDMSWMFNEMTQSPPGLSTARG